MIDLDLFDLTPAAALGYLLAAYELAALMRALKVEMIGTEYAVERPDGGLWIAVNCGLVTLVHPIPRGEWWRTRRNVC